MRKTIEMFRGQTFLGGRSTANSARNEALAVLHADSAASVVFDFNAVVGVSHSFADELLAPLSEDLGDRFAARVVFRNCVFNVADTFALVADMHGLGLPTFDPEWPDAGNAAIAL